FDPSKDVKALQDVQLQLPSQVPFPVSHATIETIKGLLRESGQGDQTAFVTSTVRTPLQQATAMYNNLEQNKAGSRNYMPPGMAVIAVYDSLKAAGITDGPTIIAAMVAKIEEVGPYNVSHHCADATTWASLQVVDVDPNSIRNQGLLIEAGQD